MPEVALFATGLHNPSHMEWTPDGRLLVSEHTAGTIKDVTKGGDLRTASPFAYNLQGPAAILPLPDGRILVAENWGGRIRDIRAGGDMSRAPVYADKLSSPYGMARFVADQGDRIYVSEHERGRRAWLTDITALPGGRPSTYLDDIPAKPGSPGLTPLHAWPDWEMVASAQCTISWPTPTGKKLYMTVGALGQILDLSDRGGKYMDLIKADKLVAWNLQRVGGIIVHAQTGAIFAAEPEAGNIMRIDPNNPRCYRFVPPVVRGLLSPTCIRFSDDGETMYVCGQADGVIWRIRHFL